MAAVVPTQPATAPVPAASPGPSSEELRTRAKDYLAREKFNRRFTLPASDTHGELTVTYAVAGEDSDSAPTMLFIGGLYGGRFFATIADYICEKKGVRFVVVDRPGMGGSTPVDITKRLDVWLETVPALMRVLNVQHVALGAHSCGTIYALNTVYAMPWILPPSNPRLHLFAPWVSPAHSGMSHLSVASHLPTQLIGSIDSIVRFVATAVVPTVQFSGMVSSAVSAPFAAASSGLVGTGGQQKKVARHLQDELCLELNGVSAAESTARSEATMRALFNEDTSGANHEAIMTMRSGQWKACESYEKYTGELEAKMTEYFQSPPQSDSGVVSTAQPKRPFILKVFLATSDSLIGKKGGKYFDTCFERFARDALGSGADNSVLVYESETVLETDHDSVCWPQYGALPQMLEDMLKARLNIYPIAMFDVLDGASQLPSVQSSFTFVEDQPSFEYDKPFIHRGRVNGRRTNVKFSLVDDIPIYDLRGIENNLNLIEHGLQYLTHQSQVDFSTGDQSAIDEYLVETEDLLKRELSADFVFCYTYKFRSSHNDRFGRPTSVGSFEDPVAPARSPHLDVTDDSFQSRLERYLSPDDLVKFTDGTWRIQVINIWRPLFYPVEHAPLAFCDSETASADDLIATEIITNDDFFDIYFLKHKPAQKWYFLGQQTPDEIALIQCFDTHPSGTPRYCPHASFLMPGLDGTAKPRQSIEVRSMVISKL